MSALQNQIKYANDYPQKIKDAKQAKKLTNQELADLSGVSPSAVNKLLAGIQVDPRLYNAAAMCQVLDLSLDELFGLKPEQTEGTLRAQVRELELENARLSTKLEVSLSALRSTRAATLLMVAFCAILTAALVAYLIIDADIHDSGLILQGRPTAVGWVFIGVAIAAVAAIVWGFRRYVRGK